MLRFGVTLPELCTQILPRSLTKSPSLALRLGGRVLEELGHVATEAAVQLGLLILGPYVVKSFSQG